MNNDKYVSKINGYKIKDNEAREFLKECIKTDTIATLKNVVSKNIFNINTMIEFIGHYRAFSDGTLRGSSDYTGIKVPVKELTTYSLSTDASEWSNLVYYDSSFTYISGEIFNKGNIQFTTPANCCYISLAVKIPFTWFQIEEGNTPTSYSPYVNLEEAMKENHVYSTEETIIGTYDGKTFYRKLIKRNKVEGNDIQLPGAVIKNAYGSIKMENGTTIPYNTSVYQALNERYMAHLWWNGNTVSTLYNSDSVFTDNSPIEIVVEYTKE